MLKTKPNDLTGYAIHTKKKRNEGISRHLVWRIARRQEATHMCGTHTWLPKNTEKTHTFWNGKK